MKKRYIVLAAVILVLSLAALLLGAGRRSVTADNVRDFAAENFRGQSEDKYSQLSLYCTEEDYLTPDGMMGLKNDLETALTAESIRTEGNYLLTASVEKNVTVSRETVSTDALATVYFGDYFGLHPFLPVAGGYVDESAATTDFCVLDDLAAWRIFGSTDVCGMDLEINGALYTVSAVVPADRGAYASYYGTSPRVYILYSSAAMRTENLCFTSLEAVLPNPITDFAHDAFKTAVSGYGEDVVENHERYSPLRLWTVIRGLTALGVKTGDTFPYYENVSRIMETKCAMFLLFEGVCWILAFLLLVTLVYLILHPIFRRLGEKRAARRQHAIYS